MHLISHYYVKCLCNVPIIGAKNRIHQKCVTRMHYQLRDVPMHFKYVARFLKIDNNF